jgi:hypothetical protein
VGIDYYPLRLDERGRDIGPALVLSGAEKDGLPMLNCSDWTDAGALQYVASTQFSGTEWSTWKEVPCTQPVHLFCFGVDQDEAVTLPVVLGKRVFVSSDWQFDGGLAGADEHCQFEGQLRYDAGIPFIAFLATTTATAASRLANSGDAGWVRQDGVWVGDLRLPELVAPVQNSVNGPPENGYVTGASSPTQLGTAEGTCHDYTDPGDGGHPLWVGDIHASGVEWFAAGNSGCGYYQLLCAEP